MRLPSLSSGIVGLGLGQGRTLASILEELGQVAEGVITARSAWALAQQAGQRRQRAALVVARGEQRDGVSETQRRVERSLRDANGLRGDADAAAVERRERDYRGEPGLFSISIKEPAEQPLREIGRQLEHAATAPVDDIKDFAITGDRATATVVYHFEKKPEDKVSQPMTFIRENSTWKVCSPGPR